MRPALPHISVPFVFFAASAAVAQPIPETLFVLRPGEVLVLRDANGDGDFLDFAEARPFAANLGANVSAIAASDDALFILDPAAQIVLKLVDLNEDGDALDFGEVLLYAQLPAGPPPPQYVAIAVDAAGRVHVLDAATGRLFTLTDLNLDGDALDALEVAVTAEELVAPVSVAARPDGVLLVAQNDATVPVRILQDRTADGDFLDFAENISYVESPVAPGRHVAAPTNRFAFLARASDNALLALHDLTGDDDCLDFGEVLPYAALSAAPATLASIAPGRAFIALEDDDGTILLARDANGDGDALDFAETRAVATGMTDARGLAVPTASAPPPCIPGDADGDASVTPADIPLVVDAILMKSGPGDFCRYDMNGDDVLDALDLRLFIAALLDRISAP